MKIYNEKEIKKALCKMCGLDADALTKAQEMRLETACTLYLNGTKNGDDGAFGKAAEIVSRRPNSRKSNVARQGKTDMTIRYNGKLTATERKINGGRVNGIKSPFTVYSLNVHNSTADIEISAKIVPTALFLERLAEFGAIKEIRHGGEVDGLAIQPSNRKLWAWLDTCPDFFPDWEYITEDFEGI